MKQNYIGNKYNNWTVIGFSHKGEDRHPFYLCTCSCGNTAIVDLYCLKYGRSKCCRKCAAEKNKNKPHIFVKGNTKHGLSSSRLYSIFMSMKQRCYNPKEPAYKYYGERGIKICNDWQDDFSCFYDWAINNGYSDHLSIDRIDVNGDYCPKNCRWVDNFTQQNNKTNNNIITYGGIDYTISQFCRTFNLNEPIIRQRINRQKIHDAKTLLKKDLRGIKHRKYFATLGGQTKSVCEWCELFNLNKATIYTRIAKHNYTPEEALTKKLKNGKFNPFLIE